MTGVARRDTARVFLFDDDDRLVLIRRIRLGLPPYLVTPGGTVEPGEDVAGAAVRECAEELGATVRIGPVAVVSAADPSGQATWLLAALVALDPALCTGHEFAEPERGSYETVRVRWDDAAALGALRPAALREVVASHGELWAAWARSVVS